MKCILLRNMHNITNKVHNCSCASLSKHLEHPLSLVILSHGKTPIPVCSHSIQITKWFNY